MTLNNETIVALGWVIGQLTVTAIAVMILQKKLNNSTPPGGTEIKYFNAAGIYFTKETGNIVIGICGLLVMLFIFPDYWDADINRMDLRLKPVKTWKERTMIAQRTTSLLVGGLIQLILILGFRKGARAVEKYFGEKDSKSV